MQFECFVLPYPELSGSDRMEPVGKWTVTRILMYTNPGVRPMAESKIRTIRSPVRIHFEERGSRFIGHLAPVDTPEGAESVIESVSETHDDATHVVWAYRIDGPTTVERSHDAGEPGGSAGAPALNVLQSEDLVNVVAVIVRYYGGTNLGYGGLVRAYARGVRDTLDVASIVEQQPMATVDIEVEYDDSGTVRSILESEGLDFEAAYEERVTFEVSVPTNREATLIDRLHSATSGRAAIDR